MPPDAAAVRAALAGTSPPRLAIPPRSLVLIGALALGVLIALSAEGSPARADEQGFAPATAMAPQLAETPATSAPRPSNTPPAMPTVAPTVGKLGLEARAELRRDPGHGGARHALIELAVLWEGAAPDPEAARLALSRWMNGLSSRELIEAAAGDDRGLAECLRATLPAAGDAALLRIDWERLELH